MASGGRLESLMRFGAFDADLRAQELRKHGLKIKLQDQPFQVLALLLERPGEVVTRDELQAKLWAADTFVDFDRGLNKAISRLREALGDSADDPHFIETLPKRGYRFIAQIENIQPASAGTPPALLARVWPSIPPSRC
jgi:DNA-binding winged helix-turn-helix (wHTH) protein